MNIYQMYRVKNTYEKLWFHQSTQFLKQPITNIISNKKQKIDEKKIAFVQQHKDIIEKEPDEELEAPASAKLLSDVVPSTSSSMSLEEKIDVPSDEIELELEAGIDHLVKHGWCVIKKVQDDLSKPKTIGKEESITGGYKMSTVSNSDSYTKFLDTFKKVAQVYHEKMIGHNVEYEQVNELQLLTRKKRQVLHGDNPCGLLISGLLVLNDQTECTHIMDDQSQLLNDIDIQACLGDDEVDVRGVPTNYLYLGQLVKKFGQLTFPTNQLSTHAMVKERLNRGDAIFFRSDLIHLGPGSKNKCQLLFANFAPKGMKVSADLQITGLALARLLSGVDSCGSMWARSVRNNPEISILLTDYQKIIYEQEKISYENVMELRKNMFKDI